MPKTLVGKTCGILPIGVDSATVTTRGLEWDLGESVDGVNQSGPQA